ncbi:4Fe-4S single cluster domain-containing protein [Actinocorallia populi]|uniref:4Fe-4S single cluster domain-containing protein n=1 Tax=Actinocorallia populi TaxID=2079200 RepID=UPI001E3391F1|nr:4Fe-4S single cluster domain-containing protein [Actinocorallia populi]
MLNVAETCAATRALGPGLRAVAWVQGCPFHCRGCLAPEWIPQRPARRITPRELAAELLRDEAVTGLTFSGGEPMAQAEGLAETARLARRERDLTLICFTGFRREELDGRAGAAELLAETDVLIDGRYVDARNDDRGLRGSDNQRVHHLTDSLRGFDFDEGRRRAEFRLRGTETLLVGVPPLRVAAAWQAMETPRTVRDAEGEDAQ